MTRQRAAGGEDGRRAATRLRLFGAAVEVIAEDGYAAATVEAIAERAGVAKGTVFYNFGSKDGLFTALLEHGIRQLAETMTRAAQAQESPLEALDAVIMAQLRFFEEYAAFARVLLTEMWRTAWQETIATLRREVLGVYADTLREAVIRGTVRADLDVETAATALFGMVLTTSIERRALHPTRPVEQLHATLVDLVHGRVADHLLSE